MARQGRTGNLIAARAEIPGEEWPDPGVPLVRQPDWDEMPELQRLRRETVITTYTIVSGSRWLRNYPLWQFGAAENLVRTLP